MNKYMKKNIYWFTLVEMSISLLIISMIILWISVSLWNIIDSFKQTNMETNIFNDINDFIVDWQLFSYNSWIIIWKSNSLLLFDKKNNWVIIWNFNYSDDLWWYKIWTWKIYSKDNLFWYFYIPKNTLSWVLINTWTLFWQVFNNWKVFDNLITKSFNITTLNSWSIFELNLEFFKDINNKFMWEPMTTLVNKDEYLKLNINF